MNRYEEWSLGYWCLKQYVKFADWLILKKTLVTGKEKIPENKPILFAPNHQNALSDPLAVLLNTRFQPVWLGRADIFQKSKIINAILKFLKIMPVYRLIDGKDNLGKNDQTFADSIKVLEHNFALALFPEAAHSRKRQMLPHKKAVPRIVFMAEEKTGYQLDIQIVPTGIYYSDYWKFNRTVIVSFGEPIPVKKYLEEYQQNPNAATLSMRQDIHDAISPLIIDIRSKNFYPEFEKIREMYGRHFLKRQNLKPSTWQRYQSDIRLTRKLDQLENDKPEAAQMLAGKVNQLDRKIRSLKIRSWLAEKNQHHTGKLLLELFILLVTFPVFLFGFAFNAIPFFLIDKAVRKKVKDFSFWSSFFLVAGIVVFPLFYLFELLAFAWLIPGAGLKILFLASLPFAGKLAFRWYILLRKTLGRWRVLRLKWFSNDKYRQLLRGKEELFGLLDQLIPVESSAGRTNA